MLKVVLEYLIKNVFKNNMIRYIIKRIVLMIVTLLLIITIVFFLLKLMPGSPFSDPKLTAVQEALLESQYGLDDPPVVQYFRYIKRLILEGDFGTSFEYSNRPVLDIIKAPFKHTVKIGLTSVILGTVIGILLGSIAALKRNTVYDHGVTLLAVIGVSVPSFVIATLLVILARNSELISVVYKPASEFTRITQWQEIKSMLLPVISLTIFVISSIMKYTRSELVEVLNSDYILLARAKGLSKTKVVFRHALRNGLIPVITIMGPMTIYLITGSTVVERFFGVPGLSQTMIQATNTSDYFLILGISFLYSFMLISVILVVDILYGIIDPRIRVAGGSSHE